MSKVPLMALSLAVAVTACTSDSDSKDDSNDTGLTCPDLSGDTCTGAVQFICDSCEDVYVCGRYDGYSLTWGWSDWACECVGDSGQLLEWDSATQTGNPNCVENY